MLYTRTVRCPYCGEPFETTIDTSGGEQEYVEDCRVCCRPIVFHLRLGSDGELTGVDANRDDD